MNREDYKKLVDQLGSVDLNSGNGRKFKSKDQVVEVIRALEKAVIQRNAIQTKIKKSNEPDLPELKEAILKVLFIYHINEWPVDGNLFSLLLWTLHSGSKSRRSQQRDQNKYNLSATLEAAWNYKYSTAIPELKLARSIDVSRTTIRRWRKEDEYISKTKLTITNDDFADSVMSLVK